MPDCGFDISFVYVLEYFVLICMFGIMCKSDVLLLLRTV